jgi:L-iditol 2-dehydrogenase
MPLPQSPEYPAGVELTAAVFADGTFRLKPVRVPQLEPGELLLKVAAVGICGTDLKIFSGRKKPRALPNGDVILGHEVVGTIVSGAAPAAGLQCGDLVVVEPDIFCGACRYCRAGATNMCSDAKVIFEDYPGGFAQFLVVPAKAVSNGQVHRLPPQLTAETGTLIEPLACVVHGQTRLMRLLPVRETALVIGGGPIGTMHALLARALGFARITIVDANHERIELLRRVLAGRAEFECLQVDAGAALGELADRSFDMVVQACPDVGALQSGFTRVAAAGGLLAFAGVNKGDVAAFDAHRLHYKDIHVIGSANYLSEDVRRAIELLASGAIPGELLVSQTFPLARIQEAMSFAQTGRGLKLVLKPN